VMTILIFIAGFALFVSMDSYRGFSFRSERDTIISVLQKARSQAISNVCLGSGCTDGKSHGVHIDMVNKQYIIFQGANFIAGDATNQVIPENDKSISFSPNPPPDIIFNQLTADAQDQTAMSCTPANCSITLIQGTNNTTVQINAEGQIDNP